MTSKNRISLDNINKQSVHTVPDGYFDELPQRIQHRIQATPSANKAIFSGWFSYGVSFAAVILVLIVGFFGYRAMTPPAPAEPATALSEVSQTAIVAYLSQQSDMESSEIIESPAYANMPVETPFLDNVASEELINEIDPQYLEDSY